MTELCNILAFCKAFVEDTVTNNQHSENFIGVAILSLKQLLVTCAETTETNELSLPLINFFIKKIATNANWQTWSTLLSQYAYHLFFCGN